MTNGIHFEPVRDEASPCSSLSSVSSFSLQDSPERQPYFHRVVRDEASPCCFSLPQQDPPERRPSSSSINRMICGLLPRSLPSRALFQFIDFGMSIPRPLLKDFEFEGDALQEINLTFRKIVDATRNFSPQKIIDSGLSGTVYKAYISGQILAVKKIRSRSINDMQVFVNEVETLKFLKHGNLVQLLGWSAQWSHHLLLIYEYMKKNSLQRTFFENKSEFFSWERRCMICLQIAKGLAYLHEKEIIHRDIKPRNILLDENLNAKISEFGLATVYHKEQRRNVTKLSGTPGYTAPEAYEGNFTEKTDVYSYGMVVLEIISGRNNKSLNTSGGYDFLLEEAYDVQRDGNILNFVDAEIKNTVDFKEACKIFKLGMLCVHYSPSLRPTMSEVVGVLEETKTIEDISICS